MRAREIKRKWIAALESGEYKQAQSTLYDPATKGFCCLGVLQHVLLDGKVQVVDVVTDSLPDDHSCEQDLIIAGEPTQEFWDMFPQLKWVQNMEPNLITFNDVNQWNFKEIAAYLRANWKV